MMHRNVSFSYTLFPTHSFNLRVRERVRESEREREETVYVKFSFFSVRTDQNVACSLESHSCGLNPTLCFHTFF